ncbi:MAG: phosphate ABC transporter permease PstA [Lachnospiraceae bacterium]|nr:phosphate ABC transporter permease PstA [Lachnospiraceae bacterium]
MRERRLADIFILGMIYLAALLSVILLAGIIGYVFVRGIPTVGWSFLTTVSSIIRGTVGIAGNIVNTLYIVVLTLLIAIPVGVGAAVWLNEYAGRGRLVRLIEFALETLAGIPSIVFGLFGMMFFGTTLGLGYSILTGALTLTIMVLPLIIINTQESLRAVPDGYREGALGMGAGKWYMVRTVLLPTASSGILTGVVLAVGRIVGESAALLFTAGSGYLLPRRGMGLVRKIMESGGTLTVQMYLSMSKGQYDAAFGIAAVLLCIVMLINLIVSRMSRFMVHYGCR